MSIAHFTTTEGNFDVQLFDDLAPKTVANFTGLAEGTIEWTDPRTGEARVHRRHVAGGDQVVAVEEQHEVARG